MTDTPWLDVHGAAAYALCSETTILRQLRLGHLRGVKLATGRRCWRTRREWIDAWIERQTPEYAARAHDNKRTA